MVFFGDHWTQQDVYKAVKSFRHTMDEDKQVLLRLQQGPGSRFHEPGPLASIGLEGNIGDF